MINQKLLKIFLQMRYHFSAFKICVGDVYEIYFIVIISIEVRYLRFMTCERSAADV